jgi:3-oxoadipate enol-lactonase
MKRISLGILWRWVKFLVISVVALVLLLLAGCKGAQVEPTMTPTSGFIEIEGVKIYYETMGKGHPVVLIHGGAIDSRMWDSQFKSFAEHYLVVRYDVPGLGKSQMPTHEFSHAVLLQGLLKSLDLDRVSIVGHSLGSMIAADFAVEYPERVTALVLTGPAVNGYPWSSELTERIYAIYEVGKEQGALQAAEKWLKDPYMKPAMENPAIRGRVRQLSIDNAQHFVQNVPARGASPPVIDRLDEIHCPTLVVVGDRDVPDMLASADALKSGIAGAEKAVIKNAGHLIPMEKPDEFNQLVLDFLGRQSKPSDTSTSVQSPTLESVHKLFELDGSPGPVWSLAWSPDGKILAAGQWNGVVYLWNAKTGEQIASLVSNPEERNDVNGLVWSPDGHMLASVHQDGKIRL